MSAHTRKKQPDLVRRSLLDSATRIAIDKGLAGVTVQAVAAASGVTKGGLFHHFPSKQALVDAMFQDVLDKLDAEIDRHMEDDASHGAFTRAYIGTLLVNESFGVGSPFDALSVAMLAEPDLGQGWNSWMAARLARHAATDSAPLLEIVRLAADGAWMKHLGETTASPELLTLRDRLLAMTRQ